MKWPSKHLGELIIHLTSGSRGWAAHYRESGDVFLRIQNVGRNRMLMDDLAYVAPPDTAEARRTLVQPGDVLLSITADLGRTGVVPHGIGRAYINQHLAILRVQGIHPPFLSAFLASPEGQRQVMGRNKHAVKAGLNFEDIRSFKIPIPPPKEQRRIAEVLDRAEALRAKRRAALAQLDSLTQSLFLELFGDPATNPKGWPTRQLQDVVKQGTIVTYGIVQAGEEFPGGIPYIRTGDIVDGEIVQLGLRHTDPLIAAKFNRSRVESGDIVMSIRATVGTTALVAPELDGANLTQGTGRISPGPATDPWYLLNFLRTSGTQHWISLQIKGATFREITLARLRELPVMLPPLALQQEFARQVTAVEKLKTAQRASLAKLDALFASLQHRAFRGEL